MDSSCSSPARKVKNSQEKFHWPDPKVCLFPLNIFAQVETSNSLWLVLKIKLNSSLLEWHNFIQAGTSTFALKFHTMWNFYGNTVARAWHFLFSLHVFVFRKAAEHLHNSAHLQLTESNRAENSCCGIHLRTLHPTGCFRLYQFLLWRCRTTTGWCFYPLGYLPGTTKTGEGLATN